MGRLSQGVAPTGRWQTAGPEEVGESIVGLLEQLLALDQGAGMPGAATFGHPRELFPLETPCSKWGTPIWESPCMLTQNYFLKLRATR